MLNEVEKSFKINNIHALVFESFCVVIKGFKNPHFIVVALLKQVFFG